MPAPTPLKLHSLTHLPHESSPPEAPRTGEPASDAVALIVTDQIDAATAASIGAIRRAGGQRVVVLASSLDHEGLTAAVAAGACGFFLKEDSPTLTVVQTIVKEVTAALPSPAPTLSAVADPPAGPARSRVVEAPGLDLLRLSDREAEVLRLLAEGLDTAEIAVELAYSARTVKSVLQDVTRRYHLRNRTHAVAYAVRLGLI